MSGVLCDAKPGCGWSVPGIFKYVELNHPLKRGFIGFVCPVIGMLVEHFRMFEYDESATLMPMGVGSFV